MSKIYIGLFIDFSNLKTARDELLIETKINQIESFQAILIHKQEIKFDGGILEINEIKLPSHGAIILTGDSGQGKTTFLDSFSGCLPSNLKAFFTIDKTVIEKPTASIRNIRSHSPHRKCFQSCGACSTVTIRCQYCFGRAGATV
jgi:translation initiation factor RLI1